MLDVPFYRLGDEAFALDEHLMKPYPYRSAMGDQKVFNYRLSRARRIVENAFGILYSLCKIQSVTTNIRTRCHKCYASCSSLHYLAQFSSNKERPKLLSHRNDAQ